MSSAFFHEPVEIILVIAIVLFISPLIMKQLNVPALVGMLLLGIVIGPSGFHIIGLTESIILLADIGLLYIMYVAGLEIDLKQFMKVKEKSILFGILSIVFPWTLGFLTALLFGMGVSAGILLGIILSSHTLIAYPIISELGVADDEAVTIVVGGTIITDVISLVVLAVVISSNQEGGAEISEFVQFFALFALYIFFMLYIIPKIVERLFKRELDEDEEFHLTLIVLFLAAFLAEIVELEAIIGAFFAGLAINRLIPKHSRLMQKIEFFGRIFFIPIFIIYIGMLVEIQVLISSPIVILLALSLIASLAIGKFIASLIIGKMFNYDFSRIMTMYSLSIPQVGVTLATIIIGVEIGLLTETVLNAGILLMMVTASIPPILTQKYAKDLGEVALGEKDDAEHLTERIMIPVTEDTADSNVVDLAGMLAQHVHGELFPIHISKPLKSSLPADVKKEDPEKILEKSIEMANEMDLPVTPMSRVNPDTLEGILNGIHESKASLLITEWLDSSETQSFSELIDRLLAKSPIPMVITRFHQPINVVPNIILVLRDYDLRSYYLHDLISISKNLSSTLKNDLIVVNAAHVNIISEEQIEKIKPERPFDYQYTSGSIKPLNDLMDENDLIIATLPPFFKVQSGGWSTLLSNDLEKLTRRQNNTLLLFNFPKERIHAKVETEE